MPKLSWIDDRSLENAIIQLLEKAKEAQNNSSKNFEKNVIDPFSAIFQISGFNLDYETWVKSETGRQAQKTLQNHIGEFHQTILGSVNGWKDMKTGSVIDLVSEERKIIAEIKNKFNTVSFGKLSDLYHSLDALIMPKSSIYKGYIAYYVPIIPKTPQRYDVEFTPSDKERGNKCAPNPLIREIDGPNFYSIVTGNKNALEQLFDIIPEVIYNYNGQKSIFQNKNKLKTFFNRAFQQI